MGLQKINLTQLDNQMGVVDLDGERLAIIACAAAGDVATPGLYANRKAAVDAFTGGRLVEAFAYTLEVTGKPCVLVRAAAATNGAIGAVDETAVAGTSTVTADSVNPIDDFDAVVEVLTGGTIGVSGITYRESLDGGQNWSAELALGTATTLTFQGSVGVGFDLAAGTLVAGDTWSAPCTGPRVDATTLAAALTALRETETRWDLCLVEDVMTSALVAAIDTARTALINLGEEKNFIAPWRVPNAGETEAQYLTAWQAAFSASVCNGLCLTAGAADIQSPISQRRYKSRIAMDVAAAAIAVGRGVDISAKKLGPRPASVRIKDEANNPKHHDELLDEGLDDERATVYRTWRGSPGVYISNPNLLSTPGSDFRYLQHARVMSHARKVVRTALELFTSYDLLVDPRTGYLLEEEAAGIESYVNAMLEAEVTDQREASAAVFTLSRTDNVLSTFTLSGALQVTPLAYPKTLNVETSFENPALRAVFAET